MTHNIYLKGSTMLLLLLFLCSSCKDYLDLKPDKSLAVPSSAADLQALLDNENRFNTNYLAAGDIAADDLYLPEADWSRLFLVDDRNTYIWEVGSYANQDWENGYARIFNANVVLDLVDKAASGEAYNTLKGSALFFRGTTLLQLAEVFTLPYDKSTAAATPGLPLRLKSDINDETRRSSLKQSYQQMRDDLEQAAQLLPVQTAYKTRPNRAAAFAALARLLLVMEEYAEAGEAADSCLKLSEPLINYNTLNPAAANPFTLFNQEVLFQATNKSNSGVFVQNVARVDKELYDSYETNDLRKVLFFTTGSDGTTLFKGDYSGKNIGSLFSGIAVDEVYLIRAEAYARLGNTATAMDWLNKLLLTRWKAGTFVDLTAATPQDALALILSERRKELVFRSALRWSDLRRLSKEPAFAKVLIRNLGNQEYRLAPGDKRYAFLIPETVIEKSGIAQNER